MAHANEEALKKLQPVLRQLREIKGLREMKPGIFYLRSNAFLHFHEDDGKLFADLKKPGGAGFDRYAVDEAPGQRKLVDDAKIRVRKLDEE